MTDQHMSESPDTAPTKTPADTGRVATEARRAFEAVLMVADQPVEPQLLAQLLELPLAEVEAMAADLTAQYESDDRGFVLARVAGGYRFQSHPDLAPYVERFVLEGQTARLSSAALETLAIVAYKQPISRAQVSAIRGVNVDAVMRTLQVRGLIGEVSRDPGPGHAVMFGTSREFLERLGVDSLDDLPALGGYVPGADVVEALEQSLLPERELSSSGGDRAEELGGTDSAGSEGTEAELVIDLTRDDAGS